MSPIVYGCADVDGTFCIRWSTTSYNDPQIVVQYWPTTLRTVDVARFFFEDAKADVSQLEAAPTRPGEYFVGVKATGFGAPWKQGQYVSLTDYG